jgi:cell division protein FtsL
MPIVLFGMRLLEVLFFVGIVGSAVVVVMATWEDIQEITRKTEHGQTIEKTSTT